MRFSQIVKKYQGRYVVAMEVRSGEAVSYAVIGVFPSKGEAFACQSRFQVRTFVIPTSTELEDELTASDHAHIYRHYLAR